MLKIRLMRIGGRQRPFYRVVAVDERQKRTGSYIELLGTYNPLTTPHEINLKQDRIDYWVKQGAQLSDGFLRMTGKAPQRPPRKPKKEKPAAISPQPSEKTTEAPVEQATVIPSENEESVANATQNESGDSSPAEPVQNDKVEEEKTDERAS